MKPFLRSFPVFLVLLMASPVYALPLSLDITIDELMKGRFVFSGDIDESFTDPTANARIYQTVGLNWEAETTIRRESLPRRIGNTVVFVTDYDIIVKGRHDTRDRPPPHIGETKQGLWVGDNHEVLHLHILGSHPAVFVPGPQDKSHSLLHPGSLDHYDVLSSHIDDLNGDRPGFATGGRQISVRIDLTHTPEPTSLWLLGGGLAGLGLLKRKAKKRNKEAKMQYLCSVCNQRVNGDMMVYREHTNRHVIDLIKHDHPDWAEENGLCRKCLEYYEAELKGTPFHDAPCALRTRKIKKFWSAFANLLGKKS